MFFLLLIFICQYLYINYILNITNPNIVKTIYNYKLKDEDINHSATIYHTNKNAKKVIIFLSGAYQLGFDFYITKIMNDLDIEYDSLMANYEFICYEKKNKASLVIYDDVYNYISNLDKKINKIEELILFGFSAGGVVASHVMARCKDMTCKKKLLCMIRRGKSTIMWTILKTTLFIVLIYCFFGRFSTYIQDIIIIMK